jgi:hypothetical protein
LLIVNRQLSIVNLQLAAGIIAMTLVVLVGNLAQVGVVLDVWYKAGSDALATGIAGLDTLLRTGDGAIKLLAGQPAPIYPGDWFWTASRAINANPGEVAPSPNSPSSPSSTATCTPI